MSLVQASSHGIAGKKKSGGLLRQSKTKKETMTISDNQMHMTEEELLLKPYITPDDIMSLTKITDGWF